MTETGRFVRFVTTGGIAAGANVAARWALGGWLSYEWAVAVAYLAGMTTAFVLMRTVVFEASNRDISIQISRFIAVNAVAFLQVWLVSVALVRVIFPWVGYTSHAEIVGHAIGVASPIATSFFLHKHFSFSRAG